jgi:thioredoxin reductase
MKYDRIIIGSGISGLYAAYNIKKIKLVKIDKQFLNRLNISLSTYYHSI